MGSHEQYGDPSCCSRQNHAYSNCTHGDGHLSHQPMSSNECALGDSFFNPPDVESCDTQYTQEPTTQPDSDYTIYDTVPGDDISQVWPQQQRDMVLEQPWNHREPGWTTDDDELRYQPEIVGALNDWQGRSIYSSEQVAAPASMINTQFGNPGFAQSSMLDDFNQTSTIADGQTFWNTEVNGHVIVYSSSYPLSPEQVGTGVNTANLNVDPARDPWSTYQTNDAYQTSLLTPEFSGNRSSNITPSTTDHDESESAGMVDFSPSLSSVGYTSDVVTNSAGTQGPAPDYSQFTDPSQTPNPLAPVPYGLPSHHPRCHVQMSMTPVATVSAAQDPPQWAIGGLGLPMERRSSTRSCVSNASSCGRPPTHTAASINCDVGDCRQPFKGQYRRGNLARHKRNIHGKDKSCTCEDDTCAREFKRQDARLKHYRKYHPELASPIVRRSSASRPAPNSQEVDLSKISSWAG